MTPRTSKTPVAVQSVQRLEYRGPSDLHPGAIQPLPDFLFPLIFLLLGLLFYGALSWFQAGPRMALLSMGAMAVVVFLQTLFTLIGGSFRGYFEPNNWAQLCPAGLKIAAACAFCGIGWFMPMGYLLAVFFFGRLVMWLFEADAVDVIPIVILCPLVHFGVFAALQQFL